MTLPNVIIAGAPKCGTTSLFHYLGDHPEVCASNEKETCFMIDQGYPLYREDHNVHKNGLNGYTKYFTNYDPARHKVFLEATPDYLYQLTPLQVLPKFSQQPFIIFIFRKPSMRIYSLFRFAQNNIGILGKDMNFYEFLTMLKIGSFPEHAGILPWAMDHSNYSNYLNLWYDRIGKNSIHVCLFEDMVNAPIDFMKGIAGKIAIEPEFYERYSFGQKNRTIAIKSQLFHRLRMHFRHHINAFPPGLLKNSVRRIYRYINVRPLDGEISEDDIFLLNELEHEFHSSKLSLERMTGIDFSSWSL